MSSDDDADIDSDNSFIPARNTGGRPQLYFTDQEKRDANKAKRERHASQPKNRAKILRKARDRYHAKQAALGKVSHRRKKSAKKKETATFPPPVTTDTRTEEEKGVAREMRQHVFAARDVLADLRVYTGFNPHKHLTSICRRILDASPEEQEEEMGEVSLRVEDMLESIRGVMGLMINLSGVGKEWDEAHETELSLITFSKEVVDIQSHILLETFRTSYLERKLDFQRALY